MLPSLGDFLNGSGRGVASWLAAHRVCEVAFDEPEPRVANLISPDDLARAGDSLSRR